MFQAPAPAENPAKIPANYANSAQFAHTVRESREIRTICSHYTLRFRCLTSGRECREIPANQVKFAQFTPYPTNYANSAHFTLKFTHM